MRSKGTNKPKETNEKDCWRWGFFERKDALKRDKQTEEETDEKGMQEMRFFERKDALKRDKQLGM